MQKPTIRGNCITIPSDLEYIADVDSFVEGIIRGWGADESLIADIAISVSELVNNAVAHGNKASPDKEVAVEVAQNDGSVTVTVTDQGGGFDPDAIDDPLKDENLLKAVGRGMFIVKSLMDKVDVRATDSGTTTAISKTIQS